MITKKVYSHFFKLLILNLLLVGFVFGQDKLNLPRLGDFFYLSIKIGISICLGVIIYGGIWFLISLGNPQRTNEAKRWTIAGLIGLIFLLIAGNITEKITGIKLGFEATLPPVAEVPELQKGAGVWAYSEPDCQGPPTMGKIKSAEIIENNSQKPSEIKTEENKNGQTKDFAFIAVWEDKKCSQVYDKPGCYNFNTPPSHLAVAQIDHKAGGTITLFRRPYFLGDKKKIEDIKDITTFDLADLKINDGFCTSLFSLPFSCFGSFKLTGPYLIAVYNNQDQCEIFFPEITKKGGKEFTQMAETEIIETKQDNLKIRELFSRSRPAKITIIPFVVREEKKPPLEEGGGGGGGGSW